MAWDPTEIPQELQEHFFIWKDASRLLFSACRHSQHNPKYPFNLDWNTVMFPFLKHNKNKLFLAVALKRSKMCSECISESWRKEWCDIKHGLFRSRIGPPEGTVVHPTDVTPSDWEDRREAEEVWVTERETERVTDWKRERQMMKEA